MSTHATIQRPSALQDGQGRTQTRAAVYEALLLDYAVGALGPAERLVVRTHMAMRPEAAALLKSADIAGGAMLEMIAPVAMAAEPLPRVRGKAQRAARRSANRRELVQARIALAMDAPDALAWGWLAPGIRRHRLAGQGSLLLRMAGGRGAPGHDHDGQELTLVLRGSLVDEAGRHGPGDILIAGPGDDHAPRAGEGEDCVCLVSMTGAWRLSAWTQRLAARLFAS
jgi:putative transcriptional regulator